MTDTKSTDSTANRTRRRFRRLAIRGVFRVMDRTIGAMVTLRDISYGGFQSLSPTAAATRAVHQFSFVLPGGRSVDLRARAVHCRSLGARFVLGWQIEPGPGVFVNIAEILEALEQAGRAARGTDGG